MVETKGIFKRFGIEFKINNLITDATSLCKILHVRRLGQKVPDLVIKSITWILSETILITFEGCTLPLEIQIYCLLNEPVEPIETFRNCANFGHIAKFCRNAMVCLTCGSATNIWNKCAYTARETTFPFTTLTRRWSTIRG